MLDKVLEVGATFDWITPLMTFAQDIANGPGHTFLISRESGRSGRDVADLLHSHGVKTWGHMVIGGSLHLRVRQNQARWAQYLLEQAGIPLEGGAVAGSHSGPAPRGVKPSTRPRKGHGGDGIADTLRGLGDLRLF